jgi:hypothetical protein
MSKLERAINKVQNVTLLKNVWVISGFLLFRSPITRSTSVPNAERTLRSSTASITVAFAGRYSATRAPQSDKLIPFQV